MTNTKARRWLVAHVASEGRGATSKLARALKVSRPAVAGWLTGHTRPEEISRRALERLLGLESTWWMTRDERLLAFGTSELPTVAKTGTEG